MSEPQEKQAYEIVFGKDINELCEQVNELLDSGYELYGSLICSSDIKSSIEPGLYQPMYNSSLKKGDYAIGTIE